LIGLILAAFGSSAHAQFGPPAGVAPYVFSAPEAAAIGAATGGGENTGACNWYSKGRGGGQYQCSGVPPAAPSKPGERGNK
jgi:hypothetical protein